MIILGAKELRALRLNKETIEAFKQDLPYGTTVEYPITGATRLEIMGIPVIEDNSVPAGQVELWARIR